MTTYPVNYEYDKHSGSMFDGLAKTAEEARAINSEILTEAEGEETKSPEMTLTTTEAGPYGTRAQIEEWWAKEITQGWVRPIKVYSGYVAEVEYWTAA